MDKLRDARVDALAPKLEDYREKYAEFVALDRDDQGVLTVRMQTDGGPLIWNRWSHRALGLAWADIGRDPENEVVILTGSDEGWLTVAPPDEAYPGGLNLYWTSYAGHMRFWESFVNSIEVPTIAALHAPRVAALPLPAFALHLEVALCCDLTLCSDTTQFGDPHFFSVGGLAMGKGVPGGSGQGLALEELIGRKRMAYLHYTGTHIDAQTALAWGAVNEVLPLDRLLPRAKEIASSIIAAAPSVTRRLQSQMFKRRWRKTLLEEFELGLAHEVLAIALDEDARARMVLDGGPERYPASDGGC